MGASSLNSLKKLKIVLSKNAKAVEENSGTSRGHGNRERSMLLTVRPKVVLSMTEASAPCSSGIGNPSSQFETNASFKYWLSASKMLLFIKNCFPK